MVEYTYKLILNISYVSVAFYRPKEEVNKFFLKLIIIHFSAT